MSDFHLIVSLWGCWGCRRCGTWSYFSYACGRGFVHGNRDTEVAQTLLEGGNEGEPSEVLVQGLCEILAEVAVVHTQEN